MNRSGWSVNAVELPQVGRCMTTIVIWRDQSERMMFIGHDAEERHNVIVRDLQQSEHFLVSDLASVKYHRWVGLV